METIPSFGAWVKRRRRTLDLTQEELAQRAGYSIVTIRKVETGGLRPSAGLAEQLAAALEIAPEQRRDFVHFARREVGANALQLPPPTPTVPLERPQISAPTQAKTFPKAGTIRLVGRKREWDLLQQVLHKAQNGQAQFVAITG